MVSCHPDDIEKIILHIGPDIVKALPPTGEHFDISKYLCIDMMLLYIK